MSTVPPELSEAWTLRRRSAAHLPLTSASYRVELDLGSEFEGSPGLPASKDTARDTHRPPAGMNNRDCKLTTRELQVIELAATGATDQQIADALFISRRTVTSHMASILYKLNVGNRTAAAVVAARTGLIW